MSADDSTPGPADLGSLPFLSPPAPREQASAAAGHLLRSATRSTATRIDPTAPAGATPTPPPLPPVPAAAPLRDRSAASAYAAQGQIPWEAVAEFREAVATFLAEAGQADPTMTDEDRQSLARQHTAELIRARVDDMTRARGSEAAWSTNVQADVAQAVFDAMFRLGRLQPLVDIEDVENIDIIGHDNVWLTIAGEDRVKYPHKIALNDDELEREINFIATRRGEGGRSFSSARPTLHLDLPGGARLAANARPILQRVGLTIRIHRHVDISLDDQVRSHTISATGARFLEACVKAGLSLVTNGFQSSGKTTMLRALADCIPPQEKIATIENERELYLHERTERHPLVLAYEYRPGEGEPGIDGARTGEYSLIQALKDSLRHTTDRIIVGEVRGEEIKAMLQAMQSGIGSMSTLHSQSPEDSIERMVTLMMSDGTNTTPAYCYRQISQNIDLIVQMARIRDRETGKMRRVVTEISEVQPGEDSYGVSRPTLNPIFVFDRTSHTLELGTLPSRSLLEKLFEVGYDERELSPYSTEEAS